MFHRLSSRIRHGVSHALEQRRGPMPRWRRDAIVLVAAACAWANPLAALAAYTCTGKVRQLTTDPGGAVNLTLIGDGVSLSWQVICTVSETYEGIAPAACKAILMTLKEAQVTQRSVTFWFDPSYAGPSKCTDADHPQWTSLRSSGWYWGPTVQAE